MINKFSNKKGMTVFIAVAIMGVLLLVSFAVVNVAIKSTLFASSGRDSQFAFYAADAGLECALYWDSMSTISKFDPATPGSPINCGGGTLTTGSAITGTSTATLIGGGGGNPTSTFGFVMNKGINPTNACAIVMVTKNLDGTTYIKSRGYNTCDITNSRRVERGAEVTY